MHFSTIWISSLNQIYDLAGHIDFSDGCWRRNELVTTIRCWWATTSQRCHQHRNSVTNIPKSSPTLSDQHHDVTNITVTVVYISLLSEIFDWTWTWFLIGWKIKIFDMNFCSICKPIYSRSIEIFHFSKCDSVVQNFSKDSHP